ncbi:MAG: tRNA (guanine(46)-N(7))-methyltransferase TrmB [Alphaproteobacteria bacterium]
MTPSEPRLYGRRKGRPLRVRKSALMQSLLPELSLTLPTDAPLPPASLFMPPPTSCWLEIGFGSGSHLAAQAAQHPDIGMIGCEPFINGIAGLLDHIDQANLRNIRIYPGDARLLLQCLAPATLARAYILFADPWPKKRHAERRFVQQDTLLLLAGALLPDAELLLATDDPVLQEWTTEQMRVCPFFTPVTATGISATRPPAWIPTRYEEKALLAGRTPLYYRFKRNTALT